MNKSLTRSIGFWLLLILALASTAVGGWLVSGQISTMTATLTDNTATGVDVYVGQSLVVVGAALLAAGVVGILLAVALVAVQSLIPSSAPVVVEPIDWTAENETDQTPAANNIENTSVDAGDQPSVEIADESAIDDAESADEDQKGSNGSTATATKINVK
ncbi:hypothetical protein [Microbacterium sp. NPDC087665]|uniref:hypothetical protein n=1 Tax=Microbacterium sp. NPDC087665 TaxID=3364194 RepID=UPI0037FD84A4